MINHIYYNFASCIAQTFSSIISQLFSRFIQNQKLYLNLLVPLCPSKHTRQTRNIINYFYTNTKLTIILFLMFKSLNNLLIRKLEFWWLDWRVQERQPFCISSLVKLSKAIKTGIILSIVDIKIFGAPSGQIHERFSESFRCAKIINLCLFYKSYSGN